MTESAFLDSPPTSASITDYDKQHLVTYLRLLDAEKEGADWKEIVAIIFDIDPVANSEAAKVMFESHLARAKWISKSGFADLLAKSPKNAIN